MSNPSSQLLKAIVPIAISFSAFCLSIWSKASNAEALTPLPKEMEWIAFMLLALLVPIYTIQATLQLSTSADLQSIKHDLTRAISEGKVVFVGKAIDSAATVVARLPTATEVLNTYLTAEEPYPLQATELIDRGLCDFVSRKDTRYEETCSELGKARVERLKARLGGVLPSSYRPRVVRTAFAGFPACNFIILSRNSADPIPEEVFFGWGYFQGNANESVFWSNNPDLIGFFRGYHKALRTTEVSVDYP